MKGKIDKKGYLHIERRGKMKKQRCPFEMYDGRHCGDWCPQFGEMEYSDRDGISIKICHSKRLFFSEILDERNGVVYTRQSAPEILKAQMGLQDDDQV